MSIILMIFLAIVAGILYLLWKFWFRPYFNMKSYRKYRSAFVLPYFPISGEYQFIQESFQKSGDQNYEYKRMLQNHPGTKFIVLNALHMTVIALTDADWLQQYFQKNDHYVKQASFYQNKQRFFQNSLTFLQGKQHQKRKAIITSILHVNYFNNFQTHISAVLDRQIEALEKSQLGQFQVKKLADTIVGDVLFKTFFGETFDDKIQDEKPSVWLSYLFDDLLSQYKTLRNLLFGVHILKLGLYFDDKSVNRRMKLFRDVAKDIIQNKLDSNEAKGSVLQIIKEKGLLEKEDGIKVSDAIDEFLGFFSEGKENTSHFLTMAFYYLLVNDAWQTKLRKEMKKFKIAENLDYNKIKELKYLQYFIKETFRHYGYIGSLFPRRCIKPHRIGDLNIRKGDYVVPAWNNLNCHPDIFPKPLEFDPMRWQKLGKKIHPYAFTPFSIGPRSCPAQEFSLLHIKIVLIKFLTAFELKLKAGYKHELKTTILYGPLNPMHVKVTSTKYQ